MRLAGVFRWFNSGANLVTWTRIPLTLLILPAILPVRGYLPEWYPWFFGLSALGIFWQGALAQILAMIADGLDGFVARHLSRKGPTTEGQFLDQAIDKVFVWIVWAAISWLHYDTLFSIAYWYLPSVFLFYLDMRSCRKHWGNYLADREKPYVNPLSGAIKPGKIKFVFQNIVICLNMAALCPLPEAKVLWYEKLSLFVHTVGYWAQPFSCVGIFIAIWYATSSLRQRGVFKPRRPGSDRLGRYAEASTE